MSLSLLRIEVDIPQTTYFAVEPLIQVILCFVFLMFMQIYQNVSRNPLRLVFLIMKFENRNKFILFWVC